MIINSFDDIVYTIEEIETIRKNREKEYYAFEHWETVEMRKEFDKLNRR